MAWFDVDKSGLAAVLERRGKSFALFELIQNAWDSSPSRVDVRLSPIPSSPFVSVEVEDDGEGFSDLDHAYTMFAPSRRAGDPMKRGRFNLGEKLVLAICRKASITTTTGCIHFDGDGRRRGRETRAKGTAFVAELRMTRDELADVLADLARLIPSVPTFIDGERIECGEPIATFAAKLPTEIADAEGNMRRSVREASVTVYATDGPGEVLELGIPVVETDTGFRVNVLQKVPMNMDRDNVTPGFLKALNAAVLNSVHDQMTDEQASATWAQEAMGDARATPEAVRAVFTRRFGERAVVATPNDPMANAQASASGYNVVPGGSLSGDAWANVRKHGIVMPASQVFPQPKPEQQAAANAGRCPTCGKPIR